MGNATAATALVSTLDDDAWDDLLSFIEERRVIPIVGPELLQVATDRGPRLLLRLAGREARRPAQCRRIADLPQPYTLNDVVCWFLAARGRREEAYVRLRSILKEANFEPPPALRRLAAITDFDLFVSTTFDPLLETAINLERFGGAPSTEVLSYAPNRVADLPAERDRLQRPGRLSPVRQGLGLADLCDLRRGSAGVHLRAAERAPGAGEAVPRARAQSPAVHRQQLHQLAGAAVPAHGQAPAPVGSARRRRSPRRRPHQPGRAADGLSAAGERAHAHLHGRRALRRGAARRAGRRAASQRRQPRSRAPARFVPPAREMPDNAVFISYAREDLAAVQQIKAGLEAAGITTWFDIDRLEVGDDYDRKIQRNIARCSYFIPVVSADHPAPARGRISAASGAMPSIACATWPTARCSSCR